MRTLRRPTSLRTSPRSASPTATRRSLPWNSMSSRTASRPAPRPRCHGLPLIVACGIILQTNGRVGTQPGCRTGNVRRTILCTISGSRFLGRWWYRLDLLTVVMLSPAADTPSRRPAMTFAAQRRRASRSTQPDLEPSCKHTVLRDVVTNNVTIYVESRERMYIHVYTKRGTDTNDSRVTT